ncbi:MAG: hypothetical protein AABX34_06430, partial [Nanoarchaeota archaeon]
NESEIINVSFINATLVDAANASEAGALTFYTATPSGVESRLVPRLVLNGSNVFIAPATGKVGIGTGSPVDTLTVVGAVSAFGSLNATFINATQIFMGGSNLVQTESPAFKLGNVSNYTQYARSTDFNLGNISNRSILNKSKYVEFDFANISVVNATNVTAANITATRFTGALDCGMISGGSDADYCADGGGGANFWNSTGETAIFTNSTSALVGIGTTKPDNKLTIIGTDADSYLDVPSILHLNVTDSQNTTVTNIITLDHLLNNPANASNTKAGVTGGIGLGILFRAINNDSEIINVSFINASLVNAINGSEAGALTFYTANKSGVATRLVPRL